MKNLILAACLLASSLAFATDIKGAVSIYKPTEFVIDYSPVTITGPAAKELWNSLDVEETGCSSLVILPNTSKPHGYKVGKNILCYKSDDNKIYTCSFEMHKDGSIYSEPFACPAGGVSIGN